MKDVQISAYVSEETKAMLESYVNSQGLKKAFFIEEALRYHLRAMSELPADVLINPDVRVSEKSMREIADVLERDDEPSEALKDLWRE